MFLFYVNPILIAAAVIPAIVLLRFVYKEDRLNGIPFVPQKLRNFPAILEHRKIQTNPL